MKKYIIGILIIQLLILSTILLFLLNGYQSDRQATKTYQSIIESQEQEIILLKSQLYSAELEASRPPVYWLSFIKSPPEIIYQDRVVAQIVTRKERVFVSANATREEIRLAYGAIEYGLYAHQFYINNPNLQTPVSGDTAFNQEAVRMYRLIEKLLIRAYGTLEDYPIISDSGDDDEDDEPKN